MSVLERIKENQATKGLLLFVAGLRFGGKTTALGTLPGKTLLLEVAAKESGSLGARNMAKKLDRVMDVVEVKDCDDVRNLVAEAVTMGYDNIAIDGLTALSVVESENPKVAVHLASKGNGVFTGWRLLGEKLQDTLDFLKTTAKDNPVNIVLTVALHEKADAEDVIRTHLELKGRMAEGFIKGMCPYFVVARQATSSEGKQVRIIQTYDDGLFAARLDGVFDSDNPKFFKADPDAVEPGQLVGLEALIEYIDTTGGNTK